MKPRFQRARSPVDVVAEASTSSTEDVVAETWAVGVVAEASTCIPFIFASYCAYNAETQAKKNAGEKYKSSSIQDDKTKAVGVCGVRNKHRVGQSAIS